MTEILILKQYNGDMLFVRLTKNVRDGINIYSRKSVRKLSPGLSIFKKNCKISLNEFGIMKNLKKLIINELIRRK